MEFGDTYVMTKHIRKEKQQTLIHLPLKKMIKTKYYIEKPINDNNKEMEYYYISSDNLTKTALFRLKPFLLAFQKLLIYDDIKKS